MPKVRKISTKVEAKSKDLISSVIHTQEKLPEDDLPILASELQELLEKAPGYMRKVRTDKKFQ